MLRTLPRLLVLTVGVFALAVFVAEEYLGTDDGDQDLDDQDDSDEPASIADTLAGDGPFGTLHMAIKTAGLVEALEGEEPLTLFAPTDEAFGKLGETFDELLAQPERLKRVLSHHVVDSPLSTSDLSEETKLKTLAGTTLTIENDPMLQVSDASVVERDLIASNGIIHGIDTVLMPPDPPKKRTRKKTSKKS